MPTKSQMIFEKMMEILEESKEGIKYTALVKQLRVLLPDIPINTIHGQVWRRCRQGMREGWLAKQDKGVYILSKYIQFPRPPLPREEDFYKPFADYLMNQLKECTKAIPLGGSRFGDKWGTPDVFGIFKFSEAEPIRPPIEIVSAEIKMDTTQLVTAFGQACAYKLFSHKVYLVIPREAEQEDINRVESLCFRFGIGLILFDKNAPQDPKFDIRMRALKSEPDYSYVNKYIKLLPRELFF